MNRYLPPPTIIAPKVVFNRRRLVVALLTSFLLLEPASAGAQVRFFDAHFFRPALFSQGIVGVDGAGPASKWQPSFKFFFNHASSPLRLSFPQEDCGTQSCFGRQDIVTSAQAFNLQGQLGLTRWLELGIDIPIVHSGFNMGTQDNPGGLELLRRVGQANPSDPPSTNIPPSTVSPLDLRVGLRASIFTTELFGLGVSAEGTLPFGDEESFAGDPDFSIQPKLLLHYSPRPFYLAANVGYHIRPHSLLLWDDPVSSEKAIPLMSVDDELTFGVGALYQIHRIFALGAEVLGAVPVAGAVGYDVEVSRVVEYDSTLCPPETPAGTPCEKVTTRRTEAPTSGVLTEILGAAFLEPTPGLTFTLGAGAGVSGGDRRAKLRIFGGIAWMPGAEKPVAVVDRDGDGIVDGKDQCPAQAEDKDGFQDEDGCPDPDNDGDGIPDTADICPMEPEDKDGFKDEDGCPDPDNDGDEVPDTVDKCPNDAEDKDRFQDEDGCPDLDNDGDNIADAKDRCPNEAEDMNGFQDTDGCPEGAVAVGPQQLVIPEQIRFKTGEATIDQRSNNLLDEIAKKIISAPQIGQIRIEGHTDNLGTDQRNQELSQRRAEAVRDYLVNKGVPAGRLQAAGYGESRPITTNDTPEGREKNRRVEFIIIQSKEPTP